VISRRGESRESRPQKLARLLSTAASGPITVIRALPGEFRQRYGKEQYLESQVSGDFGERLHGLLGAPWPCPEGARLDALLADIRALLAARGLGFGRGTYGWYADADRLLCRTVWCAVVHARPDVVIETGVAHGVTSRVVLEALTRNELGHLWSIDLPFPFDRRLHAQTGVAVTDACRGRWSYLEGSSRQRLPPLVAQVGHVEMFIHDSLHTARNTTFEAGQVAPAMPPGSVMVIDDIRMHQGFAIFAKRHPEFQTLVCRHDDRLGMFGVAVKTG
jgi:Methyltransferase domain